MIRQLIAYLSSFQDAIYRKKATESSSRDLSAMPAQKQPRSEVFAPGHSRTLPPPLPTVLGDGPTRVVERGKKRCLIRDSPMSSFEDQGGPTRVVERGKKRRLICDSPITSFEDQGELGSQRSDRTPQNNQKQLSIEEAIMNRSILPKVVPPPLTHYSIDGGKQVDGDDFQNYLGVNNNDTIEDAGVASRLVWSTILSRDKKELFRGFPEGEDLADYYVMKAVQQVLVVNAQHRIYQDQADKELQQLKAENDDLKNAFQQLQQLASRVEELKIKKEDLRYQAIRLQNDLDIEGAKSSSLRRYEEAFNKTFYEFRIARAQCKDVLADNRNLIEHQKALENELARLRSQSSVSQNDRDYIRAEAVMEYRLSMECFEKKQLYATGFIKYGFYLARFWLEQKRIGETFPELQFTEEVESCVAPDWTKYEPDSEGAEEYLERWAQDDLTNLSGPWEPRYPRSHPESIEALQGLDNEDLHFIDTTDRTSNPPVANSAPPK